MLYQTSCGDKTCLHKSSRRLLAGRTYGEIAADYKAPRNWVPIDLQVCPLPSFLQLCASTGSGWCAITRRVLFAVLLPTVQMRVQMKPSVSVDGSVPSVRELSSVNTVEEWAHTAAAFDVNDPTHENDGFVILEADA